MKKKEDKKVVEVKKEEVKKERKPRTTKTPEVKIREACITCGNDTLLEKVREIVTKADKANKKTEGKFVTAEDFFGVSKQESKKDELMKKFDEMMVEMKKMRKMVKKI